MYVYLKSILFIIGLYAAATGIFSHEISSAIVSLGAFVSFAMIEIRDLKTLNDNKD
ncbi:MAG: hypothetical protein ABUT20_04755 [Bacteroidota bacterium]